jgi:hypothetical protein
MSIDICKVRNSPGSVVQLLSQAPVLLPLGGQSQEDAMQHGYLGGKIVVCVGGSYRGWNRKSYAHMCGLRD